MILYEKRGRRYYPVNDTLAYEGLPNGTWLVVVDRGCKRIEKAVEADLAGLQAAIMRLKRPMGDAMVKAMGYGCVPNRPLRRRERKAYEEFCLAINDDKALVVFQKKSAADVIEAGFAELTRLMKETA